MVLMLLMVMIMVTTALSIVMVMMVVLMLLMVVIMVTAALSIVMVMMVVLMLFMLSNHFIQKLLLQFPGIFYSLKYCFSIKLIPRSGYYCRLGIVLPDKFNCCI